MATTGILRALHASSRLLGTLVVITVMGAALCLTSPSAASQSSGLRLAMVNVPNDVVEPLLPMFLAETRIRAAIVYTGNDPFSVAREGKADLVISHYGHEGVEPFVTAGLGLWPHAVFANQVALLGPPSDPARVRGLTDPVEAFRRIARTKSRYVVNSGDGVKYLEDILAAGAGESRSDGWYMNKNVRGPSAARAAAAAGAYLLWGMPPFLRLKRQEPLNLEPLVVGAPQFQRIMVSIVVNPSKVIGVNAEEAKTFERYLLTPKTQAWVEAFRYPDFNQQAWWAAGRHNLARE